MTKDIKLQKFERILGRQLSEQEVIRLTQIKDVFEIHDNDALWDMILIMEYYTTMCLSVPQKIETILSTIPKQQSADEDKNEDDEIEKSCDTQKKILNNFAVMTCVLFSLVGIALGYILPRHNIGNVVVFAKIFLASITGISCIYFSIQFIKHSININKKWFINIILAFVFLLTTLSVLFVV